MILSWVLLVAVFGPAVLVILSHWHGRSYQRRRSAGMNVWASVRVPGLPRWLGARAGVSRRI